MLYRDVIAVYCDIHTKRLNALRRQGIELLSIKPNGTYIRFGLVLGFRRLTGAAGICAQR